jgi:flagellar hook-associated protein 2
LEKKVAISSPGIGSNLDVNGIVSKLMAVEAQPLNTLEKKASSFQAKLTALGALSGGISGFQTSLQALSSLSSFQSYGALSSNTDVMVGSATNKAVPGTYKVNVTQIAQAQTLSSIGKANTTSAIGLGGSTTLSFQLGTVSGGSYGLAGTALPGAVITSGVANGSLSINGTAIATDGATRSAKALAEAINAKNATTGVSATALPTQSSATLFGVGGTGNFGPVDTMGGGTYTLSVGGVTLYAQGDQVAAGDGATQANIDAVLAGSNATTVALNDAGISWTGSAADGTLQFTAADGRNLTVAETTTGLATGGIDKLQGTPNGGTSTTTSSTITLSSSSGSPITVAGSTPAAAGLVAGTGGNYVGASFAQDPNQVSGTVVIDSTNNSLAGIRDAINKANIGVTATIVSDGSANPNHIVLTSTKTGAASSMKIDVSGTGGGVADTDIAALLAYDPAGVQNLKQNQAAQSTLLNVNGIAVTSETTSVPGAIQGVTMTIGTTGSANLVISRDTNSVKANVAAFVKAYNDLSKSIKDVSGYDPETKKGGVLLGDSTVQNLQASLRRQLTTGITGLTGGLSNLSQVGISFQKDGSLALDSGKLDKAITSNFSDIAALFAAVGNASDNLVSFNTSTAKTKPGDYALNVTTLARQGSVTSDAAVAGSTVIAANTKWSVTLNETVPPTAARTQIISLAAGTYTAPQLATLIQSAINGASGYSSNDLAVNAKIDDNGKLVVASAKYGSVSKIAISSQTATAFGDIFGAAVPDDGVDIAGTIGGLAAKGSGQFLTGAVGGVTEGLKIEVTGGALGDRGTVGFSQGYAYQLNNLASSFLGSSGFIAGRTTGLNATIKDIDKQKEAFSERLVDIEKRYRAQYTALDTSISSMSATSSFLTQQFAAMAKQTS